MQTEESTDQTQPVTLIEDLQYYLQEVCEKTMILLQTGRNKTHLKKLNLIVCFFFIRQNVPNKDIDIKQDFNCTLYLTIL